MMAQAGNQGLPPSPSVSRRRFPWNIILLTIFVSLEGKWKTYTRGRVGDTLVLGWPCSCFPLWLFFPIQLPPAPAGSWRPVLRLFCVEPYSIAHAVLNHWPHSLLPADFGFGLCDRHYFQVCSGTILHALGEGMSWKAGWTMGTILNIGSLFMASASGPSQRCFLFPSMYETKAVIIAMIITAVVSISVTIFCFQTKVRMGKAFL